jgi:hypothetical protein
MTNRSVNNRICGRGDGGKYGCWEREVGLNEKWWMLGET